MPRSIHSHSHPSLRPLAFRTPAYYRQYFPFYSADPISLSHSRMAASLPEATRVIHCAQIGYACIKVIVSGLSF